MLWGESVAEADQTALWEVGELPPMARDKSQLRRLQPSAETMMWHTNTILHNNPSPFVQGSSTLSIYGSCLRLHSKLCGTNVTRAIWR